jgi:hypothetical protein
MLDQHLIAAVQDDIYYFTTKEDRFESGTDQLVGRAA